MMSKKFIKILCIILAALMILSCVAVVFSTFAVGGSAVPTGDNDMDVVVPIAIAVVAFVAIVACIILQKIRKKDKE